MKMSGADNSGFMNIKLKKGDIVRLGNGVVIELKADGESSARVSVSAPRDIPIVIERGIPSPFQPLRSSGIG